MKPYIRISGNIEINTTTKILNSLNLSTVCQEASCPNIWECFGNSTATFMLMGNVCTRACKFCNVATGIPQKLSSEEGKNIALAAEKLNLKYIVLTCVTRDDLADGGASHFVEVIREIRKKITNCDIEVLTSDFNGNLKNLEIVLQEKPTVFNHNLETVKRLNSQVRAKATYQRSLKILEYAANKNIVCKTGLMVGFGETMQELQETMQDAYNVGCSLIAIGQYLQPSSKHFPVIKYYTEQEFEQLANYAKTLGFKGIAAGLRVRSSYNAKIIKEQNKIANGKL